MNKSARYLDLVVLLSAFKIIICQKSSLGGECHQFYDEFLSKLCTLTCNIRTLMSHWDLEISLGGLKY
jgi:hypothetical protein